MCPRSSDPRAVRTRDRLRMALLDLLRSRPWAEVTVAEVVTHAACSRSSFYAHYDDLDDLLTDSFVGAVQIVPPSGRDECLAFVPGLFDHLSAHRFLAEPYLVRGHAGPMTRALRERIELHIQERMNDRAAHWPDARRAEVAAATAGAVWAAVMWWLEHGRDVPPAAASAALVALLAPGLPR